ncbi:hypothetical protein ACFO25_05540 [Paenactinomyces guangxiensis]|uniref:Uncharacterized protein n=1 Tax=Paenactinomyces guangxiensis TaxID=1490290 RepID=A0A7W1WQN2_9BACL|nr:hypothetical protein [Paenactinomyces guangxiensis]MBA4494304.1 hypothetical protein [Paenactinomyces guangxiensis]MBH8590798.1 hypothetical protein [Paenactinomyces guangxiensis]
MEDQTYIVAAVYVTREILGETRANGVESGRLGYFPLKKLPDNMDIRFKDCIGAYLSVSM